MFSQFFGEYLLRNKYLTASQLRDILADQDSIRVKLGILAIDSGYMTPEQAEYVHQTQLKRDKRFGEIAIDEGIITEDQLTELLRHQNKRHLLLSQAVLDRQILDFETLGRVLNAYKRESGLTQAEFDALKNNDIDAISAAFLKMPEMSDSRIYTDYLSLFVRNLVRFIDDKIFMERGEKIETFPIERMLHQVMEGRIRIFTAIAASDAVMAEFASRFSRMRLTTMDTLARDAMGEFMNTQNGLFLSKLSNDWIDLELVPPEFAVDARLRAVGVVYRVPFALSFGRFDFLIGVGSPVIGKD